MTLTVPVNLVFLTPKISVKFDWGQPLQGRQIQVGLVKICNFQQISGYKSKMVPVKDRHTVSVKVK